MGQPLINCDLGENESDTQTEKLLGQIDLANICCGVHAGSAAKTAWTLERARRQGTKIGAHPGLPAAGGRGAALPGLDEFDALLHRQVSDFCAMAKELGAEVDSIKLHGSLYHAVEQDEAYADTYREFLQRFPSRLAVVSLAGGHLAAQLGADGIEVWPEGFVDRAYSGGGGLLARSVRGAVLDTEAALEQFRQWRSSGRMPTVDGSSFAMEAMTFCVHGDSPNALTILSELRRSRGG
ncbi:MAG: LamB/YcsF family protein [Opitutales bacterium]